MNPENKKYLHISQHWGINRSGKNPIQSRRLSSLEDLSTLIKYHNWSDNKVYYSFSDSPTPRWGSEVYEVKENKELVFVGAEYDTSD